MKLEARGSSKPLTFALEQQGNFKGAILESLMSQPPVLAGEAILPVRCMGWIKTHEVHPYKKPCVTQAFVGIS